MSLKGMSTHEEAEAEANLSYMCTLYQAACQICNTVYVQIFEAHNFRGLLSPNISRKQFSRKQFSRIKVSSIWYSKTSRAQFSWIAKIHENRKNYAPRKFGHIRYRLSIKSPLITMQ